MPSHDRPRRRAVLLAGGSLTAALAGCLGFDDESPAQFDVTVDGPDTVDVGESVTIGWEVTNRGDRNDTQEVTLSVNGEQQTREEVTLAGGENRSGTFAVTPGSEGALPATVTTGDDTGNVTVLVESP